MNNHSCSLPPHFLQHNLFQSRKTTWILKLMSDSTVFEIFLHSHSILRYCQSLTNVEKETVLLIGIVQYLTEIELLCPAKDIRQLKQMTTFSFLCATREADLINNSTCRVCWLCSRSVGMDELKGSKCFHFSWHFKIPYRHAHRPAFYNFLWAQKEKLLDKKMHS